MGFYTDQNKATLNVNVNAKYPVSKLCIALNGFFVAWR